MGIGSSLRIPRNEAQLTVRRIRIQSSNVQDIARVSILNRQGVANCDCRLMCWIACESSIFIRPKKDKERSWVWGDFLISWQGWVLPAIASIHRSPSNSNFVFFLKSYNLSTSAAIRSTTISTPDYLSSVA
jgi:hypothetical protein